MFLVIELSIQPHSALPGFQDTPYLSRYHMHPTLRNFHFSIVSWVIFFPSMSLPQLMVKSHLEHNFPDACPLFLDMGFVHCFITWVSPNEGDPQNVVLTYWQQVKLSTVCKHFVTKLLSLCMQISLLLPHCKWALLSPIVMLENSWDSHEWFSSWSLEISLWV